METFHQTLDIVHDSLVLWLNEHNRKKQCQRGHRECLSTKCESELLAWNKNVGDAYWASESGAQRVTEGTAQIWYHAWTEESFPKPCSTLGRGAACVCVRSPDLTPLGRAKCFFSLKPWMSSLSLLPSQFRGHFVGLCLCCRLLCCLLLIERAGFSLCGRMVLLSCLFVGVTAPLRVYRPQRISNWQNFHSINWTIVTVFFLHRMTWQSALYFLLFFITMQYASAYGI